LTGADTASRGLTTTANAALVVAIPNRFIPELNQTHSPIKEELFAGRRSCPAWKNRDGWLYNRWWPGDPNRNPG
jgi:hypothetical protein